MASSTLNPRNRNQWRFTYETLAHIPTLRLYLFSSAINPSLQCLNIRSDLQLARSLLVVSWIDSEKAEEVSVRVPVPRVLIDPGSAVEIMARDDHVEVRMVLVLPVDHPVAVNLRGVIGSGGDLERGRPLELDSDLKNLSSGGLHLFCKACSTRLTKQPLRKYTLERVFVTLLLEGAKEELSYRIVLRDLGTKSPMLQIVLLNSESWCSTGYCSEHATMKALPEIDLQPVVKVLFSDCSTATEASSRIIKDWSSKTHTEDVYMMTHQIEELTKCLKSAADRLPYSCSCLQGMSLSSMER